MTRAADLREAQRLVEQIERAKVTIASLVKADRAKYFAQNNHNREAAIMSALDGYLDTNMGAALYEAAQKELESRIVQATSRLEGLGVELE